MGFITLEQFYYIAEIAASAAVFASLIYLAIQIRQNTNTVKSNSAQNCSHDYQEVLGHLITNADMADIHLRGMKDVACLSPAEKHRFYLYLNKSYRVYDNAYYHYSQGSLDNAVWHGIYNGMILGQGTSGYQAFWKDRKYIFSDDFQNLYDEIETDVNLLDAYQADKANS